MLVPGEGRTEICALVDQGKTWNPDEVVEWVWVEELITLREKRMQIVYVHLLFNHLCFWLKHLRPESVSGF